MTAPITLSYLNVSEFFGLNGVSDFEDILNGLVLNDKALYKRLSSLGYNGQLINELIVHHNIYLRFKGIEYRAETGFI